MRRKGELVCLLLGAFGAACGAEFPNEPTKAVTLQPAGWPGAVFVTDVDTVDVNASLLGSGTQITGLRLTWQSSDDGILKVVQLQPAAGASREDTMAAQLRAVVTGQAGGLDTVSVVIEGGSAFRPVTISDTIRVMQKWVSVSAGYEHTCGVTVSGEAFCWGTGLIGNGSTVGSPIPVRVTGQLTFRSITAGNGYTCGTLLDGRAYCWGRNRYGAIGNSLPEDELTPVPVSLGQTFASVSAGGNHVCGITTGTGFCWGDNFSWQLGDGGLLDGAPIPGFDICDPFFPRRCSLEPRPVEDRGFNQTGLLAIGPGVTHTCAILTSGDPICWGSGSAELGSPTATQTDSTAANAIVAVPGGFKFTSTSAGLSHNCGLTAPQSLAYCWGLTSYGQLGTTFTGFTCPSMTQLVACSPTPLPVPDGHTFSRLSVGERSTCGIDFSFAAYCWGSNQFGQLGTLGAMDTCNGNVSCSLKPLRLHLLGDPSIVSVSVGQKHACAVTANGAAYCWGEPAGGKLGNDSLASGIVPVTPVRVSEPQ